MLNNLSSTDILYMKNMKKRRPYVKSIGVYEAEQVVASRNDGEVGKKNKFLLKSNINRQFIKHYFI